LSKGSRLLGEQLVRTRRQQPWFDVRRHFGNGGGMSERHLPTPVRLSDVRQPLQRLRHPDLRTRVTKAQPTA
jgi:hypothetical protein